MRIGATYLAIVPGHGFVKIHGPTFFLARAKAALQFACDPMDIKPAIRFTMGKP